MELATKIQEKSATFSEIAAQYSEDSVTASSGGSFGGIAASELLRVPEILDALGAMHEGEVSKVVETFCGFHILYRRSIPPVERVSGARIVIGHDGAGWLRRFGARRAIPSRSRGQALALAREVYERARTNSDDFGELVEEYSEHRDAIDDGDLGEWSTHEVSPIAREIEVLAGLSEGAVAPPIEALFGFEILRRSPARPRKEFAMEALRIDFDAELPDDNPRSKVKAWTTVSEAAEALRKDPTAWPRLYSVYGLPDVQRWSQGRAPRDLEAILDSLNAGDIAHRPVEWNSGFVLARAEVRHSSPGLVDQSVQYELPHVAEPDIEFLFAQLKDSTLRSVVESAVKDLGASRQLSSQELLSIEAFGLSDHCQGTTEGPAQSRPALDEAWRRIELQLGRDLFVRFRRSLLEHMEAEVLSAALATRVRPVQ
jgi:hypothetical protein